MQRRYESLQLRDAIGRRNDYAEACRELRCVLRAAYVYAPKPLQALLYDDIVHAFRSLPRMETSRHFGAAMALLQTVVDLFPEHRRGSAAQEYQTAVATRQQNPAPLLECLELSRDALRHVFAYLDARSLAAASAVCREWNVAAADDTLWRNQYLYLFGTSNPRAHFGEANQEQVFEKLPFWRNAFNLAQKDRPSLLFTSSRAFCPVCEGVLWLVEPPWVSAKGRCVARNQMLEHHSPKPMSVSQVVRYVVSSDTASASESSGGDSDSSTSDSDSSTSDSDSSTSDSDEDGRDDCANTRSRIMKCTNFL